MKIPGYIVTDLFLVTILTTFMVLFITLPISPTKDNTLGESIFGLIENLQGKNADPSINLFSPKAKEQANET